MPEAYSKETSWPSAVHWVVSVLSLSLLSLAHFSPHSGSLILTQNMGRHRRSCHAWSIFAYSRHNIQWNNQHTYLHLNRLIQLRIHRMTFLFSIITIYCPLWAFVTALNLTLLIQWTHALYTNGLYGLYDLFLSSTYLICHGLFDSDSFLTIAVSVFCTVIYSLLIIYYQTVISSHIHCYPLFILLP